MKDVLKTLILFILITAAQTFGLWIFDEAGEIITNVHSACWWMARLLVCNGCIFVAVVIGCALYVGLSKD